ncbi:MAG TPA: oligosaccharide flippase family protein [Pseudobacteroides sp.]|uniref:lipopolysaccharide biosynthesis protein n=1 Tax=Pseudobacteroides sp. TaxID=1968840 RepID=UPI002F951BD5
MGDRVKYLMKNTSIFAIGEMGTKLINFFLVPFYTYILATQEYGTVDLIFTLTTVIVPLVMFNIGEAIMRYAMDDDAEHDKLLSIGVTVIVFGTIFSLILIPIVSMFRLISGYAWYMYVYVVLCASMSVVTCYLRGKEKLVTYVSCNLLNTFLIAIFNIVFLLVLHEGIHGYLMAYILAQAIAVVYAILVGKIYKDIKHYVWDFILAKKMILFSLAVVPNSLLWWCISSSNRIMITAMCNVSENGLLAVSYKLPSLLTMVNTILMQAWKFSAIKERNSVDRDDFTNNMLNKFLRVSVLISGSMILVNKIATKILFAEPYYMSWRPSAFLFLGFMFLGLSTFVGTIYYVEKNMVGNMLSALVGATVNVILSVLLISNIGATGATLAACICYFVVLVYRYFDTKKYQNINVFAKQYVVLYCALITMAVGSAVDTLPGTIIELVGYAIIIVINYKFIVKSLKSGTKIIKTTILKR